MRATRWPNAETVDDWEQGIPLAYVQEVCQHWAENYDWRAREALLNQWPQFMTEIDGLDIHFLHQRSPVEGATPLLISSITTVLMFVPLALAPAAAGESWW